MLGHLALADIRRNGHRGRPRALLGLALSYLVIVVATASLIAWPITTTVAGTAAMPSANSTPETAPPPASAAPSPVHTVPAVSLLTLDDDTRLVNAPNLNASHDDTQVFDGEKLVFSPPECITVFGAYELLPSDPVAQAAGPMAMYDRSLQGPVPTAGVAFLEETVVRLDSAAAAQKTASAVVKRWRGCAGNTVSSDGGDRGHMDVTVEQPATLGAVTTVRSTYINGVSLERAVAIKHNVLVDLSATGVQATDEIYRLAQAIVDRIPG